MLLCRPVLKGQGLNGALGSAAKARDDTHRSHQAMGQKSPPSVSVAQFHRKKSEPRAMARWLALLLAAAFGKEPPEVGTSIPAMSYDVHPSALPFTSLTAGGGGGELIIFWHHGVWSTPAVCLYVQLPQKVGCPPSRGTLKNNMPKYIPDDLEGLVKQDVGWSLYFTEACSTPGLWE